MTDDYKTKLEDGLEFQDYVCDRLRKGEPSIIIGAYCSRKYQVEHGESMSGIEIKHDKKLNETGNLYIEVAEKSRPDLPEYVSSGIFRNDNSWLYLIGDYNQAFLFSKKQLQVIYANEKSWPSRGIRRVQTPTSIAFLYPVEQALKNVCLKHFKWQ